ncbi:helix-turn-helix domain-containing protein [Allomuricauda sp. F6463D]|uniref:helix-turn-helix domain-containing protein n=1 Tax=Allomuricauda sp. F6463D TaxID=2926409 RepID=UPI001FF3AF67|nr:AraC family transcriptional regulator [Muricauda sp. F6463D]MCK0160956.1 AraC family transcriptional regulator [Muricauda sp. F6463D]
MESILESDIFQDRVYRKRFTKDFLSKELVENSINIKTPHVKGTIKELQLNGLFVVYKDINAAKGYSYKIENDFETFKLHFEISGNYSCFYEKEPDPIVVIPEYHYNMFYLPRAKCRCDYMGAPTRTLELFFTLEFVKKIAGDNYDSVLERVNSAINSKKPYVFWNQPCPISQDIFHILEEITDCSYDGVLRQNYLQSKITGLLVELLIEANKKSVSSHKSVLSKSDLTSLHLVEKYIKSNLNRTLTIEELATKASFNTSKLKRDFKRLHGTTVFKYITQLRMEKAHSLISNDGFTIAQAAYEVGYLNPQHFTKAFKRTLGYLPSTLKK